MFVPMDLDTSVFKVCSCCISDIVEGRRNPGGESVFFGPEKEFSVKGLGGEVLVVFCGFVLEGGKKDLVRRDTFAIASGVCLTKVK